MKKNDLIKMINVEINEKMSHYGFNPKEKNATQYFKAEGDLQFVFSFQIIDRFDTIKKQLYFRIDPYVSLYNDKANAILSKLYKLKSLDEFYLLTTDIASIHNNPSGECKKLNTTLDIRYYPNESIKNAIELLIKYFVQYGLVFYEKFKNLEDVYLELIKPVTYSSIYSWILPGRIIDSIIVSHLLNKEGTQTLINKHKDFFDGLQNQQLVSIYKQLNEVLKIN